MKRRVPKLVSCFDQILQRQAQPRAVNVIRHISANDQSDGSFLLRDNDRDTVGLFGDAERCPMARAPGFSQVGIGAER